MTVFFTSDTHFGHNNIIEYCNRPFKSIEDHDESLIKNWNSRVRRGDVVYHLGDFALNTIKHAKNILRRLHGNIQLIYGNHDQKLLKDQSFLEMFFWHGSYKEISIDKQKIVLFHFPIESWNKRHYNSWHLHGHSHGTMESPNWTSRLDVGVDCFQYCPISFEDVKNHMSKKTFKANDHHRKKSNINKD